MKQRPVHLGKRLNGIVLFTFLILLLSGFAPYSSSAKTAREIDVAVDVALEKFYREVEGAQKLAAAAHGMLVLPRVIKGAFFIGGEYGEGALLVGGRKVAYYSMAAGSFGLQIGGQEKNIIIMFMTREALDAFRNSEGWEVGVDGNVAFIDVGAGKGLSTYTGKDPVVGFVFGAKGLIADISLKGAKFTRLKK